MSSGNNEEKKLSPTESAIIQMMKKQSLQPTRAITDSDLTDEQKAHAFWDTQVRLKQAYFAVFSDFAY
jgi:hypothetical protein